MREMTIFTIVKTVEDVPQIVSITVLHFLG